MLFNSLVFFFYKSYLKLSGFSDKYKFLLSKIKYLFIIYISWSVFYFFIIFDGSDGSIIKILTKHFLGFGWSGQYYFLILFQLIIFSGLIYRLYDFFFLRILTLSFVIFSYFMYNYNNSLVSVFYKIGDKFFIYWIPYIFLGIWLSRLKQFNIRYKFLLPIFLLSPIFIPLEAYFTNYNFNSSYLTFSGLISSSLFSIFFFNYNVNIFSGKFEKIISYVGSRTMIIFVANPIFVIFYSMLFREHIEFESLFFSVCAPFFSTIIVIISCLFLNKIISKSRLNGFIN